MQGGQKAGEEKDTWRAAGSNEPKQMTTRLYQESNCRREERRVQDIRDGEGEVIQAMEDFQDEFGAFLLW